MAFRPSIWVALHDRGGFTAESRGKSVEITLGRVRAQLEYQFRMGGN